MRYRQAKKSSTCPMAAKSMLPVPVSIAINPSNSLVVAWPKTFGPKMEKTVLAAAQTSTRIMLGKNFFR